MLSFLRKSLVTPLIGGYLIIIFTVLAGGVLLVAVAQQVLRSQVEASDRALAQDVAVDTGWTLRDARMGVQRLTRLPAVEAGRLSGIATALGAFRAGRPDVDHVYWTDPFGLIRVADPRRANATPISFEPPNVIQSALTANAGTQVLDVGVANVPQFTPGLIIAEPVRSAQGRLVGVVAISLSLQELSQPLASVVAAQAGSGLI